MPDNSYVSGDLVLAMDTSEEVCSVAALRGGVLISEHIFRHGMHLSERLLDHVTAVLADAEAKPEDIDLFGVGIGPGSFTGTRIGVMTVKTFASLLNRPVYGIDSLAAMSRAFAGVRDTLVVPMHPCRSGIVYTGSYDVSSGEPDAIRSADALAVADLARVTSETHFATLLFCGTASVKYRTDLVVALGDAANRAVFGDIMYPRAFDIGAMTVQRRSAGIPPDDAQALVPHYVSPPPITMPKVRQ